MQEESARGCQSPESSETRTPRSPRALAPVLALLVAGTVGLLACGILPRLSREGELAQAQKLTASQLPVVKTEIVRTAPLSELIQLPSTVLPVQDIPVYARTDGYLKERRVEIGDRVKAGQILAIIETPEVDHTLTQKEADARQDHANYLSAQADYKQALATLKTAQANIARIKASLAFSRAQVVRYTELASEGAISAESKDEKVREVDTDLATLSAQEATVESVKQQCEAFKEKILVAKSAFESSQAEVRQWQTRQAFHTIVSPADGVVTARNIDAGALITHGSDNNNQEIVRIARTDVLRIIVNVPQAFAESVKPGQKARIICPDKPKLKIEGQVAHAAGGLDGGSRTLQVEIRIPNKNQVLMPGMFVRTELNLRRQSSPLLVPSNCLVVKPEGQFVAVLQGNKVTLKAVEIFRDQGPMVEISAGLKDGEIVVVDPPESLANGSVVQIARKGTGEKQ